MLMKCSSLNNVSSNEMLSHYLVCCDVNQPMFSFCSSQSASHKKLMAGGRLPTAVLMQKPGRIKFPISALSQPIMVLPGATTGHLYSPMMTFNTSASRASLPFFPVRLLQASSSPVKNVATKYARHWPGVPALFITVFWPG